MTTLQPNEIGTLPTYRVDTDCLIFQEQLNNFCYLNNITDDNKKVAMLLLSIDEEVYSVVKWFSWPIEPIEFWQNKYTELCNLIQGQFPILKCTSEAFRIRRFFYMAKQMDNESATDWFHRIRNLSLNCKFGQFYEIILLDRFVSGLKQSQLLENIFNEPRMISLQDTLQLVQEFEK